MVAALLVFLVFLCAGRSGERGFVFVGPKGGKLRRSNFRKSVWNKARQAADLPNLHFHDLRHAGGTLSAARARRSKS